MLQRRATRGFHAHHHHSPHHRPHVSHHSSGSGQDKVRTHLLFSSQSEHKTTKRKKRTHNKLIHQMLQHQSSKRDEMVQAGPDELDPTQWSGNQRVLHYGPMAQRDPFFYYYPKGWDVLYPAQFGFFPYRTSKFRGSSTAICVWAFGLFLFLGGCLMIYLGYYSPSVGRPPFWEWSAKRWERQSIPPIQVAGPVLFAVGVVLMVFGLIYTISTSSFLSDKLRHHHHKDQTTASVLVYTTHFRQPRAVYEKNPYQPMPPPAHEVWENRYAHSTLFNPLAEAKLYPPVMPGYSTLSLHHSGHSPLSASTQFLASPYNTLRAISPANPPQPSTAMIFGRVPMGGGDRNRRVSIVDLAMSGDGEMGAASGRRQSTSSLKRRARSAGSAGGSSLQRSASNRSQQ